MTKKFQQPRRSQLLCLISFLLIILFYVQNTQTQILAPEEIKVPEKILKRLKSFEPSAAIYIEKSNVFLIAIDDTEKKNSPILFLMNEKGEVGQDPVVIDGVNAIMDIESLITDGDYVYIVSSQSRNKKGLDLKERNLFVRGKFDGKRIVESETIELRPLLLDALSQSRDPRITQVKGRFDKILETEGSFIREGKLFVGLKDPQSQSGQALVLELGDVDQIFRSHKIDHRAFKVAFQVSLGVGNKLSEIIVSDNRLILASTKEGKNEGNLWSYDDNSGALKDLRFYSAALPEGLAIGKNRDELLVLFDQGEEKALFTYGSF